MFSKPQVKRKGSSLFAKDHRRTVSTYCTILSRTGGWIDLLADLKPQRVDLTASLSVTDVGLESLISNCPKLVFLSLVRTAITDSGIRRMVELNPRLRHINLRFCKGITDQSVGLIAQNCKSLCELYLGFTRITDQSLMWLSDLTGVTVEIDQCTRCSLKRFQPFRSEEIKTFFL
eukprot:TRINITY_DN11830_c0_g2_i1.p1 TRINITY_DN11830_c0_g2~~TRINITY_DN11830_c0_g2_i1.p1  ORF type:complete len:175 (-),score=17.71 TRINITY_DN11830_c0_g2_i1:97-621(-)